MVYDQAGGHVIIGRCSQGFIVCALSMFQTFYNCVYRKILKPSVKKRKGGYYRCRKFDVPLEDARGIYFY